MLKLLNRCNSHGKSTIFVSYLPPQPSSDVYLKILAGDEVIQVNDQIVVSMAAHVRVAFTFYSARKPLDQIPVWRFFIRWGGAEQTL